MTDYINREKEIQSWKKAKEFDPHEHYPIDVIIDSLKNAPSVDAVEVVRCKDCKYNGKPYCDLLTTGSRDWYINDDDYCKWGEKE